MRNRGGIVLYKLCKTEQSAVRQRELEKKLVEMMNLHRYEEISVSDFCAYAGIPRKAFYRYFSSKDGALYALLDHTLLEFELFRSPRMPDGQLVLYQEMETFFQFWKDQKQLLDALRHSGMSGILIDRAVGSLQENLRHISSDEDPQTREHVLHFAVSGLMIMMVNWHHREFPQSVQEMVQIGMRLLGEPLFRI